jgi:hypothetical protein
MPSHERKPLAAAQSKESCPIRLHPHFIAALKAAALVEGIGWTTLGRECLIEGFTMRQTRLALQQYTRTTA